MQFGQQNKPRQFARWTWIYFLYYAGLIAWARRRIAASSGIVVLTLHRVLEDAELATTNSPSGMIVRKSTFESLLNFLQKTFEVLPLSEKSPSWKQESSRLRMAVTFDDGWKDTSDVAFPLTEKSAIPMTVFVCPGLAGMESPFWPETVGAARSAALESAEAAARFRLICGKIGLSGMAKISSDASFLESVLVRLKDLSRLERDLAVQEFAELRSCSPSAIASAKTDSTMTWDDTKKILGRGVQIGSHTQTHQILTTIPLEDAANELQGSKSSIEGRLGIACPLFAYPNGSWSVDVAGLVGEAGYALGFANSPGVWDATTNLRVIPRVNIWEGSLLGPTGTFSAAVFQYSTIWRCYRAHANGKKKQADG